MKLRNTAALALLAALVFTPAIIFRNTIFPPEQKSGGKQVKPSFEKEGHEALDALQWIGKTRAYPNADIPNDAYAKAFQQMQSRFSGPQNTASGNWTSIGPTNRGGRTLCVTVDPTDTNKVWLGSASGGLWKSTTGGLGTNAWTYVPIGFPVLGVSTIAINPQNTNEMYIGTGEDYNYGTSANGLTDRTTRGSVGMGIFKSTDGGATWTQCLNWTYQQQRGVWEILINPLRPATVFAATTEGVYKSTDSGNNWTQVLNVKMCMDLALHNTDTTVVMVGAGNLNSLNKGLYRSTDGGLNWNAVTSVYPSTMTHAGRIQVSLYPANNDIVISEMSDIYNTIAFYKSTNKGATWTQLSAQDITGYQGWYCKGLAFKNNDQNEVLAGGVSMYRADDGGSTFYTIGDWTVEQPHADVHDIVQNPQNPNSIFVITDGGLFRSWDFGDTYQDCNDGYVTAQCYIGSVSRTDPTYMQTGLQDNNTIVLIPSSTQWYPIIGGDGSWNAIDAMDDNIAYGSYQFENVFQTTDHWSSAWQILSNPANATGGNTSAFLAPFLIAPGNDLRLYAGGTSVARSDDQGMTFNTVSADPVDGIGNYILDIEASSTDEDSIYITTSPDNGPAKVMLSSDGGINFADRSSGLPNRFPRRILVDPRNSKIAYVVYSGFGTGHIFKTTNAGVSWTDISALLPDVPFHCITCDPQFPDILYAGSDIGLFVSTNAGATWTAHNTGLPDWTMVFDLVPSYSDRMLLCFTHGHGVYKRSLNDVSGIPQQNISAISTTVFPNPANENATLTISGVNGAAEISVYDLAGKVMYKSEREIYSEQKIFLETATWPAGVYFAKVETGDRANVTRLVVAH